MSHSLKSSVAAASCLAALCLVVGGGFSSAIGDVTSGFFTVDIMKPNCSDSGPGTVAVPFCTIGAGVAHGGPGITIFVKPGVYREQVTLPVSGASGNPFTIQALGSPVIIEGADNFSSAGLWTNFSGTVWRATSVTADPVQVLVDGARLDVSTDAPGSLPTGSFRWVSGEGLYVNLGAGGNPGTHDTQVSARSHGFRLPGRSYVTIEGFVIRHAQDNGIYLVGPGTDVTVRNNEITLVGSNGIGVVNYTGVIVGSNKVHDNSNHGIGFINNVSNSTVENNECYLNSRPGIRAASGVYLHGSPSNVVQNNRCWSNQDTGVEVDSLSHDTACRQNLSWNNGDHGFSHLRTSRVTHLGDVAWNNFRDGFSIEGNSSDISLFNCIAIDNGLAQNDHNLFVDPSSTTNLASNYNIIWNSTAQDVIRYNGTNYPTVAAFRSATGLDAQTLQLNASFVDAPGGDFGLQAGSPAIDSGFSGSGWPSFDADGHGRFDDPATPNTGTGSISYSDRGALEYQGQTQTGVDDHPSIEGMFFSSAFPNPTFGKVSFVLEMPREGRVEWTVLDLQGRSVWSEAFQSGPGRRVLNWEGNDSGGSRARAGLYLARVNVNGVRFARRFVLVR